MYSHWFDALFEHDGSDDDDSDDSDKIEECYKNDWELLNFITMDEYLKTICYDPSKPDSNKLYRYVKQQGKYDISKHNII